MWHGVFVIIVSFLVCACSLVNLFVLDVLWFAECPFNSGYVTSYFLGGKGGVGWAATAVVCWSCVLFFQGVCLGVDHGGVAIGVWLFSGAFVL